MLHPMSVGKIGGASGASNVGRSGSASKKAAPGAFRALLDSSLEEVEATAPTQSVHAIGSLLAAQETGDALDGESKARQRGEALLDRLHDLRIALIDGKIPLAQLEQLARQTQSQRARTNDPHLASLLDEIDLRAQVELAKYQR